jgi:hypothetical protein
MFLLFRFKNKLDSIILIHYAYTVIIIKVEKKRVEKKKVYSYK